MVEFRRKLEQERQLEEMIMEIKKQFEKKKEKRKEDLKAKLPKLVISRRLRVQPWIGSSSAINLRLRLIKRIT